MASAARLALATAALLALGALGWLLLRPVPPPDAPLPVAWNRVSCARCGMLVGEPAFAAQVQTQAGEVLHFDDPGCLLLHEAEPHSARHAVWLHHHREDRWLRLEDSGFVPAPGPTPMGYGLGAVELAEAPGALTPEAALTRVRVRDTRRTGAAP